MASKALFISVNELKKKSIIDGNVDDDKITQFIEVAQDKHVQNYIGTSLSRKLNTLILDADASPGTGMDHIDNVEYKTLWTDYIKPMMIWYSQDAYFPFAMFQVQNGGVYKHRGESSDNVTLEEMRSMMGQVRDNAEFYTRRFIDYMCDNEDLFPEYTTQDNDSDMRPGNDVNYSTWVV